MNFRILYEDSRLIAIDKPPGFFVHPPEDRSHRISQNTNCLLNLRKQTGKYLYPVHRLDRATSGVVLFALDSEAASAMGERFRLRQVKKTYFCVTRGWPNESGSVEHVLKGDEDRGEGPKESLTHYERLAQIELPFPVGRYATTRYSLMKANPHTGRMHQIRRHFAHLSHPLVGDTIYGDGAHNRFFREKYEMRQLLLRAHSLEFMNPMSGGPMKIQAHWRGDWHRIFDLFGVCPFSQATDSNATVGNV